MEDTLIQFETAKLAKEKGFNFKVLKQYSPNYEGVIDTDHSANCVIGGECALKYPDKDCFGAPTQSLLQKWLREVHQIEVTPVYVSFDDEKNIIYYDSNIISDLIPKDELSDVNYYSTLNYEEALEEGLLQALKLIK